MTDQEIRNIAYANGFISQWTRPGFGPDLHDHVFAFARAILAESEAAQKIKVERGFMGTVARAALEECAAEAPQECAEFICAYIDKYYP